ncbi:MAG TPA: hypothetical protein PK079_26430 [Leptospiraceae bacterium]|nr:hypothetical protein [Leptospiraceae bacterium]HNF57505.1 hypothetical protein [Leptospiraceae bacterium]
MIKPQEILTSEEKQSELAVLLELSPIPSVKISDNEKLEYIKFMLANPDLFHACGGRNVQVAMARNLVRIKNKKRT